MTWEYEPHMLPPGGYYFPLDDCPLYFKTRDGEIINGVRILVEDERKEADTVILEVDVHIAGQQIGRPVFVDWFYLSRPYYLGSLKLREALTALLKSVFCEHVEGPKGNVYPIPQLMELMTQRFFVESPEGRHLSVRDDVKPDDDGGLK